MRRPTALRVRTTTAARSAYASQQAASAYSAPAEPQPRPRPRAAQQVDSGGERRLVEPDVAIELLAVQHLPGGGERQRIALPENPDVAQTRAMSTAAISTKTSRVRFKGSFEHSSRGALL